MVLFGEMHYSEAGTQVRWNSPSRRSRGLFIHFHSRKINTKQLISKDGILTVLVQFSISGVKQLFMASILERGIPVFYIKLHIL